jgi:hypothetical protein
LKPEAQANDILKPEAQASDIMKPEAQARSVRGSSKKPYFAASGRVGESSPARSPRPHSSLALRALMIDTASRNLVILDGIGGISCPFIRPREDRT